MSEFLIQECIGIGIVVVFALIIVGQLKNK